MLICLGNNVSLVLETEELLDFVYQHIDRLNAQVEKLGYNTHFEMKVAADSSDRLLSFVKDFIEAEARPTCRDNTYSMQKHDSFI